MNRGGSAFIYDDEEAKQNFLDAMELINEIGLSLKEVEIDKVYVPREEEDQLYSMAELEERGDSISNFITTRVAIKNVNEISSTDDIYYLY